MDAILNNSFSWILFIASIVTCVAFIYDYKKSRPARLEKLAEQMKKTDNTLSKKEKKEILEPHGVAGQLGSLFFIVLIVFIFRSFIIEPFRIPSGSMLPTLQDGDFIAVSKWNYGIRNPLTNNVLIKTSTPERGDVIVFKYPEDKSVDFIKRVVGLPGDVIIYQDKHLYILKADAPKNSMPELILNKMIESVEDEVGNIGIAETYDVFEEKLTDTESHRIRINPSAPMMSQYFYRQTGKPVGMWKVPEDCYFAMGDNRDNSKDSRFWGFVPLENIVGKTQGIWLSFDFNRDANSFIPSWIPSALRFDRIGGLK